jgi:hypothetical protein
MWLIRLTTVATLGLNYLGHAATVNERRQQIFDYLECAMIFRYN